MNNKRIYIWRTTDASQDQDSTLHYHIVPRVAGYRSGILRPPHLARMIEKIRKIDAEYELVFDENETGPQPHKISEYDKEDFSKFL